MRADIRLQRNMVEGIFVFVYAAVVAIVVQHVVGDLTIYRAELHSARLAGHVAMLNNVPPTPAGWNAAGMNQSNTRVGTVYLATALSEVSGLGVLTVYKLIDMVALVCAIALLYVFLRYWFTPPWALLGLALLTAALPLTLLDHYFQPHDRLTLVLWIAMLLAIRADRPLVLALLLAAAVPTKYDALAAPGLYFLSTVDGSNWLRQSLITTGLSVLAFGIALGLFMALPGGSEPRDVEHFVMKNLTILLQVSRPHPVVLGLGPLFVLGLAGWPRGDRFMRTAFVFGLLLVPIFFTLTNFHELRAMMMVFVMMLPLAIAGALRLLGNAPPLATTSAQTRKHPVARYPISTFGPTGRDP